jgi:HSP20 family protein
MTIGPDGIPRIQEFGNVHRPRSGLGGSKSWFPELSGEREPIAEVSESGKEVKVTLEMPGRLCTGRKPVLITLSYSLP